MSFLELTSAGGRSLELRGDLQLHRCAGRISDLPPRLCSSFLGLLAPGTQKALRGLGTSLRHAAEGCSVSRWRSRCTSRPRGPGSAAVRLALCPQALERRSNQWASNQLRLLADVYGLIQALSWGLCVSGGDWLAVRHPHFLFLLGQPDYISQHPLQSVWPCD